MALYILKPYLRPYFDKQISVPTYATNHSDPFAASAPPVEPTLLLTRPSRSPIFLTNNIITERGVKVPPFTNYKRKSVGRVYTQKAHTLYTVAAS